MGSATPSVSQANRRLFGTDGVRGLANDALTVEVAVALARAAAAVLAAGNAHRPTAVVGRDPRASGDMLAAATAAGLTSMGVDTLDVGVLPTPAVAFLTGALDADFGVMISASHNPMPDNGIKFFATGGHKLSDALEDRIEAALAAEFNGPVGAGVGRVRTIDNAAQLYLDHLEATDPQSLHGLHVVVDCANGAASEVAPAAYEAAGARVTALHHTPDGTNINDNCGSTHLESLRRTVVDAGADLGIAHDGDADRCLAVDAAGNVVDGDAIMAILAIGMKTAGVLAEDTLVATVMSNLGLHRAMSEAGITLRTTAVGDRYVLDELRAGGYSLGGEQSGHVVIPSAATTGDGVLTALEVMRQMARTGQSLAALAAQLTVYPQVLVNITVADKHAVAADARVLKISDEVAAELGDNGRVLVRKSGTEQLVRVMVEAASEALATDSAERIATVVREVG